MITEKASNGISLFKNRIRQETWIDSIFLTCVTFSLWSLTGPKSGMGYETSLINYSNDRGFFGGFIFVDPLRPFTSFSYHAANEFSKIFFSGSFFGIQLFFCALLVLRVLIFYFIIIELFSNQKVLALIASLLFATYSADGATLWVGQMNQISCSLAALSSLLLLAKSTKAEVNIFLNIKFAMALVLQFFSIWSYEAVVFPLLVSGILVIYHKVHNSKPRRYFVVSWAFLPISYCLMFAISTIKNLDSYRSSLVSQDLTLAEVLSNLVIEFKSGLDPLGWFLSITSFQQASLYCGMAIAIVSIIYLKSRTKEAWIELPKLEIPLLKIYLSLFFISLCIFIPFALSTSATNLWRTHLIASAPLALIMGVFLWSQLVNFSELRMFIVVIIGVVVFVSSVTFFERGIKHQKDWEIQRNVAIKLLRVAPCIPTNSNLVLLVKKESSTGGTEQSAFGDNYWFQQMLNLVYPNSNITGFYLAIDGTFPPGVNINEFDSKQMLILRQELGRFEIQDQVPDILELLPVADRRILTLTNETCEINRTAKNMYLSSP
jgi:hypothetical protein